MCVDDSLSVGCCCDCRFQLPPSLLPEGVELWVKRDDLSGMQLSGNKVGTADQL